MRFVSLVLGVTVFLVSLTSAEAGQRRRALWCSSGNCATTPQAVQVQSYQYQQVTTRVTAPVASTVAPAAPGALAPAAPQAAVQVTTQATTQVTTQSYGDPYGFLGWLNATRAQNGLRGVNYDANLSAWCNSNNAQQASRGMGHHVMGPARRQNCAMAPFHLIGSMWMNSPDHRSALLDPSITEIGIAGWGTYWTFNAR